MSNPSILFVCLGNICRSPLAEGIGQAYAKEKGLSIDIQSAGTGDWHIGEPPCENSIKVARINGIDISTQRARQVQKSDFSQYDIIVGLDNKNIASLKALGCKNALLLGDFGFNGENVPDPYFFDGFEGFDRVYNMIEVCVKNLINEKVLNG